MRIVMCDDNRLLLEALSNALALQGFTVEAATSTPAEAVAAVRLYDPDILLIDLGFEGADGLTAAREVARSHPRTRVVILTGSDDPESLLEAMRIGVAGYVRKDQRLDGIVTALRRAAEGESAIDKTLLRKTHLGCAPAFSALSSREPDPAGTRGPLLPGRGAADQ